MALIGLGLTLAGGAYWYGPERLAEISAPVIRFLQPKPPIYKMAFTGDIMLARGVRRRIDRFGGDFRFPFLLIADELRQYDLTFGNLENPISARGRNVGSIYSFRADPRVIEGLKFGGFDIVSLANNHIWDWSRDALADTVSLLAEAGIESVGAGENEARANDFMVLRLGEDGLTVAFLAYTTLYPRGLEAWGETPGVSHNDIDAMRTAIARARSAADLIVVSMHWGVEYKTSAGLEQRNLGRALIDAGADLVVGHHPHVAQELERYGAGWIAYSLGNFVFDQNFSKDTMRGKVLEVSVQGGKITEARLRDVFLNSNFQPALASSSLNR